MDNHEPSDWARRDLFYGAAAAGWALTTRPARAAQIMASASETSQNIIPQPQISLDGDLNTADVIVETLIDWGATHAFGIVGDGVNSVIEALRKRRDQIRFIPVRHEEAAAFMASGFATHTGRLGVCIGTTGPAEPLQEFIGIRWVGEAVNVKPLAVMEDSVPSAAYRQILTELVNLLVPLPR
jgi:Thiamine pyrophosphate enzyme, N-terminal TPP binding domain